MCTTLQFNPSSSFPSPFLSQPLFLNGQEEPRLSSFPFATVCTTLCAPASTLFDVLWNKIAPLCKGTSSRHPRPSLSWCVHSPHANISPSSVARLLSLQTPAACPCSLLDGQPSNVGGSSRCCSKKHCGRHIFSVGPHFFPACHTWHIRWVFPSHTSRPCTHLGCCSFPGAQCPPFLHPSPNNSWHAVYCPSSNISCCSTA